MPKLYLLLYDINMRMLEIDHNTTAPLQKQYNVLITDSYSNNDLFKKFIEISFVTGVHMSNLLFQIEWILPEHISTMTNFSIFPMNIVVAGEFCVSLNIMFDITRWGIVQLFWDPSVMLVAGVQIQVLGHTHKIGSLRGHQLIKVLLHQLAWLTDVQCF